MLHLIDLSKSCPWAHTAAQSLTPAMQVRRKGNRGAFGSCHLHRASKRHWDGPGSPGEGQLQHDHINSQE